MLDMMEHIDMAAMDDLRALMGDEFQTLVDTFYSDSVLRIEAIKLAVESENPDSIYLAAHDFKGSSSNMAALKLADLCRGMEKIGRSRNIEQAKQYLLWIEEEFLDVKIAMEAL